MGISGMRERMNALHGTFKVTSSSSGTTIAVTVPINPASHSPNDQPGNP